MKHLGEMSTSYANSFLLDQESTDKAALPSEGALCAEFKKLEVICLKSL